MAEALSTIRNIGPALESAFQRTGINDAETLRDIGADAGYLKLLNSGVRPHFSVITSSLWDYRSARGTIAKAKKNVILGIGLMRSKRSLYPMAMRRKLSWKKYLTE